MAILAVALSKADFGRLQSWAIENVSMISWSLLFTLIGLLHLAQPATMLRWTIRTHPELADSKFALRIAQLIGAGLLVVGLGMLVRL